MASADHNSKKGFSCVVLYFCAIVISLWASKNIQWGLMFSWSLCFFETESVVISKTPLGLKIWATISRSFWNTFINFWYQIVYLNLIPLKHKGHIKPGDASKNNAWKMDEDVAVDHTVNILTAISKIIYYKPILSICNNKTMYFLRGKFKQQWVVYYRRKKRDTTQKVQWVEAQVVNPEDLIAIPGKGVSVPKSCPWLQLSCTIEKNKYIDVKIVEKKDKWSMDVKYYK